MKREQIEEKARKYADKQLERVNPDLAVQGYHRYVKMGLTNFSGSDVEEAYTQGAIDIINGLWHEPDESPCMCRLVIEIKNNGNCSMAIYNRNNVKTGCRWAYASDILPIG